MKTTAAAILALIIGFGLGFNVCLLWARSTGLF